MSLYGYCHNCGCTLDSLADPHVYVESHHGLSVDFYCTSKTCLSECFGDAVERICISLDMDDATPVYSPFLWAAE